MTTYGTNIIKWNTICDDNVVSHDPVSLLTLDLSKLTEQCE